MISPLFLLFILGNCVELWEVLGTAFRLAHQKAMQDFNGSKDVTSFYGMYDDRAGALPHLIRGLDNLVAADVRERLEQFSSVSLVAWIISTPQDRIGLSQAVLAFSLFAPLQLSFYFDVGDLMLLL